MQARLISASSKIEVHPAESTAVELTPCAREGSIARISYVAMFGVLIAVAFAEPQRFFLPGSVPQYQAPQSLVGLPLAVEPAAPQTLVVMGTPSGSPSNQGQGER